MYQDNKQNKLKLQNELFIVESMERGWHNIELVFRVYKLHNTVMEF